MTEGAPAIPPPLAVLVEAARYRDYFECLGVGREASTTEVRDAYRRRVEELDAFSPLAGLSDDLADAIADARQVIEDAFEVLSDPDRRLEYRRAL
jgi:curved DNA-binding protein CbpA